MRTHLGIPLVFLAALTIAAPACADTMVAQLPRDTPIAANSGVVAYSSYDSAGYHLMLVPGGAARVPASAKPFDVSLGRDAHARFVALYTRCTNGTTGCDVYSYDLQDEFEKKVDAVSSPTQDEAWPVQSRNRLVFVRRHATGGTGEIKECDVLYAKLLSSTAPSKRLRGGTCGETTGLSLLGTRIAQVTFGSPPTVTRYDSQVRVLSALGGQFKVLAHATSGEESNQFNSPSQSAGSVFVTRTGVHPTASFVRIDRLTGRRTEIPAHTNLTGPYARDDRGATWYVEGGEYRGESCNDAVPVPCRLVRASANPFTATLRPLLPQLTISTRSANALFGDPFTLSGRLTQTLVSGVRVFRTDPLGGVTLEILRRVTDPTAPGLHEGFQPTGLFVTTQADGNWSLPLTAPPSSPWFSAVTTSPSVATTYAGRGTTGTVQARVTLAVSGGAFAGTITPAQPGRTVAIQRLVSRECPKPAVGPTLCIDRWTTVGQAPVDATGTTFATTIAARPAGTYSAALPFADQQQNPALYSGRSPDVPVG